MLKSFSKLTVRNQLLSLLGVMGLTMVVFSSMVVYERSTSYFENRALEKIVKFSVKSSAFVHELQKERGMTAGFTKSRGRNFAVELPKQRELTNKKRDDFLDFLEASGVNYISKYMSEPINKALSDIDKIEGIRNQVDALSIAPKDAIGFYTNLNGELISSIAASQHESKNPELLLQISSYVAFLQAKERAGIERAVGTGGFSSNFSAKNIIKFNALITTQEAYLNMFKASALTEQVKFFETALKDDAVKEVDRMRDIARMNVATGDLNGITGGYWFKTITKKINILKSIDDKLAHDLLTDVQREKQASLLSFVIWSVLTAVVLLIVAYLARGFVIGLNECFNALKGGMKRGSAGNFSVRITNIKSEGEMREVQELANTFMDQTDVFIREAAASMEAVSKEEYYRKMLTKGFRGVYLESAKAINAATVTAEKKAGALHALMNELEETVKTVVNDTSSLANNMKETSSLMLSSSTNSVTKSNEVEGAASVAQDGTSTVAAAVEEMSASIGEISSQSTNAMQVVGEAQDEIKTVSTTVEAFGSEVDGISSVVDLIKDIAEQTNLLALNATIEAARAGDAGKGFAVVASEVKSLAGQTAKATEDISAQIEAIQNGSNNIVSGVESISETMKKVSEISGAISAAVEEQSVVTQEISSNMQRTSQNVDEVKGNIASIKAALEETATSASSMSEMTETVSSNIMQLDEALERVINKQA